MYVYVNMYVYVYQLQENLDRNVFFFGGGGRGVSLCPFFHQNEYAFTPIVSQESLCYSSKVNNTFAGVGALTCLLNASDNNSVLQSMIFPNGMAENVSN